MVERVDTPASKAGALGGMWVRLPLSALNKYSGDTMRRALIAEDNRLVREILTAFVTHTDKFDEVDSVESGEEAMELFEPGKYALVILDISLTGISGIEVAFLMRQVDKEAKLVAITGYTAVIDQCDLKTLGFDEHFLKPVGYVEFFNYVDDM